MVQNTEADYCKKKPQKTAAMQKIQKTLKEATKRSEKIKWDEWQLHGLFIKFAKEMQHKKI